MKRGTRILISLACGVLAAACAYLYAADVRAEAEGVREPQKTCSARRPKASCTRASGSARFMRMWQGPLNARPSCQ